jgi:hypothetical protein
VFSAIKLHLKSCRICVRWPSVFLIAEELLRRSHHDLLEMSCVRLDDGNAEDTDLSYIFLRFSAGIPLCSLRLNCI